MLQIQSESEKRGMNSMLASDTNLESSLDFDLKSHDIDHRKKIGAFYTPLSVSAALSDWGIRSSSDLILEPCFGGCTFLEAAILRLSELGNPAPEANLYGCDIDPLAFSYLKRRIKQEMIAGHFFQQDFLTKATKRSVRTKVDLVIGNPPYIKHSNFSKNQREAIAELINTSSIRLHGRANLWAYFVVHALRFLKAGGRLALVLPGSFLYAEYSASIRELIRSKFERVVALTIAERLFLTEGTEETTVVLLAEGFNKQPVDAPFMVRCIESIEKLTELLKNWHINSHTEEIAFPGHGLIPVQVGQLYQTLASVPNMRLLGDLATVRIGLVTGDTPFFIKSRSEWKEYKIDNRHLKYIMPRSQYVSGISVDQDDRREHIENNIRCLALRPPSEPRQKTLTEYLASYPMEKRVSNSTFQRRPIWYQFEDTHRSPDAFFVFMADKGPRLILNLANANSTNSMYRVYFTESVNTSQMKLIALSIQTTFTQLAAEIIGHPRGSGALKLEPSSALKLNLFLPNNRNSSQIDAVFKKVNEKLRLGDATGARLCADAFFFKDGAMAAYLPALHSGLEAVRNRRMR
jgi:adenine-specific DNA-methyltransferase